MELSRWSASRHPARAVHDPEELRVRGRQGTHEFRCPRHRGGPMFYAETIGLPAILDRVNRYRKDPW